MLRHLQVPQLARRTITIRVDYLVRVISLLLLIGILTSCVPEEDAVESNSSGSVSLGNVKILWGTSNSANVTFSEAFKETSNINITARSRNCGHTSLPVYVDIDVPDNGFLTGFRVKNCSGYFDWMAIGK